MKKTHYLFCGILLHLSAALMAQNQMGTAYIMFYPDSDSTYKSLDETAQEVTAKVYQKFTTKSDDGKVKQISFWIQKENFEHFAGQQQMDTIDIAEVKSTEFKSLADMENDHIASGYFLKGDTYDKIYLVEKISDHQAVRYDVKWVDYEE